MSKKLRPLILSLLTSSLIIGTGPTEAASDIRLQDSHIQPDYVEVERLKSTKEVIVIAKEDIKGKGYKNLGEVLNDVPGISVGLTGWGDIDIRGQGSEQAQRNIQVMLDGAPITTLTSHPFMNDYNYIPVDNIEKIEVIPGGGSVMYGSGASGGVVNITTNLKRLNEPSKSASVMLGQGEKTGTFNLGDKVNDQLTYQFSYTKTNKDMYFVDTYRNSEYWAGGLSYQLDPTQRLSFRYSHLQEEGQLIASLQKKNFDKYGKDYVPQGKWITVGIANGEKLKRWVSGYLNADRELDMYSLNYAKNFSKQLRLSADIFYNDGYFKNNSQGDKKMDHTTEGVKLKLDHAYGSADQHSVLFGLDYYTQEAKLAYDDYTGGYGDKPLAIHPLHFFYDKKVRALYASNNLSYGKWSFVQGLRREFTDWGYDKEAASSSGKDTRKSKDMAYELAAAYQYNDIGSVYARYEKGFTHPDGIQMADDYGDDIVPSIASDEKFDIYEIGLRDKIGISTLNITAFYSETDNQIDRFLYLPPGGGLVRRSLNLYDTERHGVDLSLRQKIKKWTFTEGYSYLKGKSDYNKFGRQFMLDAGEKLRGWTQQSLKAVPKHKFVLRTQYAPDEKVSLAMQYKYVGRYNNFIEDKNAEDNQIGSHKIVDFDITYKVTPDVTVYTGVKNAFNEKYASYQTENSGGYYSLLPGDERMYYVMTSYKF